MTGNSIRFEDGSGYEHMMGKWSRLVGEDFVTWLAPPPGLRWIDVGCGNGASTELLVDRCAPSEVVGVDPSEAQLAFARARGIARARFELGKATALHCPDHAFDAAMMALVLFFVPEPEMGVAEMRRAVRPGGPVCAYVWDVLEPGGFPLSVMQEELKAVSSTPMLPPRADVSTLQALADLWTAAGLVNVRTKQFTVSRTFKDFADFWSTVEIALGMGDATRGLSAAVRKGLEVRLRERLPVREDGSLIHTARANAVAGLVPN